MASTGYFVNFPTIKYNNTVCTDISRRSKVLDSIQKNVYSFYPVQIQNEMRVDQIADRYYDDMNFAWLIMLSNQIIDPYYDWKLSDTELDNHLEKKFGNLVDPQQRISFWRNNYYNDDTIILENEFDALPDQLKRYWEPIYQANASFTNFRRVQEDWSVNVNQIKSLSYSGNTDFSTNDLIMFYLAGTQIGSAQISRVQNTSINYNQVQGYTDQYLLFSTDVQQTFIPNEEIIFYSTVQGTSSLSTDGFSFFSEVNHDSAQVVEGTGTLITSSVNQTVMVQVNGTISNLAAISYITGSQSNVTANVLPQFTKQSIVVGYNGQANLYYSNVNSIATNISLDEQAYWSPVTEYDIANERNTYNSTIRLIDKSYATVALQNLKQEMAS